MTADRCGGFQVFPSSTFYPLEWGDEDRKQFFTSTNNDTAEIMRKIKAARTIHVWNQLTKGEKVCKGSVYAQIAQKFCPSIYSLSGDEF